MPTGVNIAHITYIRARIGEKIILQIEIKYLL